jgi:ATP-dependent helicase Lhr and Lhr-like helicase
MNASRDTPLHRWFASLGRTPFEFQQATWDAYAAGKSGLVHAPTGSGKTLSVIGGPLIEAFKTSTPSRTNAPFTVLWLTPMRALATDTAHAISTAVQGVGLAHWKVELRTSDTTQSVRKRQRDRLPAVLVTTPESLSMLLSYAGAKDRLASCVCIVADEWHELMSSKRGTQAELGIARLAAWNPSLRIWGLSATIGNLPDAAGVLCHSVTQSPAIIHADIRKELVVESLIPKTIEKFPWGGHMGLRMLSDVAGAIDRARSTLLFTNTRAQAEIWFKELLKARPDFLGQLAIHHGSLDRKVRLQVEGLLRSDKLKAVVCTSSLDLGVDFSAVDQVLQIGSPKGIARLMQRAGRSGHRPGEVSRVACVPTHAFELAEFSAARHGIKDKDVESRMPVVKPLDLLAQHVVTIAAADGFDEQELFDEVRRAFAFRNLSKQEWQWVLDFVLRGGPTLTAYPRFMRIKIDDTTSRYVIASDRFAKQHRLTIGTISGDGVMNVVTSSGKKLGTIEESFIGRLKPGDHFYFGGKSLVLLGTHQMNARVRPSPKLKGTVPQWAGGRFPLSTRLADRVRMRLHQASTGEFADAEMKALRPLLLVQERWSIIPKMDQLLIEQSQSRDGFHSFVFSFLGRLVHEGLAAVVAHRIKNRDGIPVTATLTDYGFELLTPQPMPDDVQGWSGLLSSENLLDDLLTCLNAGELTKRQFRDIARVAGLIVVSGPGQPRSNRQLQASSELFYDVFCEFDPENLLLQQARREVLEQQLEFSRLKDALEQVTQRQLVIKPTKRFTPLAFPIWAQRIQSQTLRVEAAQERIERMIRTLEKTLSEQTIKQAGKFI